MLHFMADWCQPCYASKPIVEKYLKLNPDVIYTQINIDDKELFNQWSDLQIMSIPSFVGIINNEINRGHSGVPSIEDLDSIFQP